MDFQKEFIYDQNKVYTRYDLLSKSFELSLLLKKNYHSKYLVIKSEKNFQYFVFLFACALAEKIAVPYDKKIFERVFINNKIEYENYKNDFDFILNTNKTYEIEEIYKKFICSDNPFLLLMSSGTVSGGKGILLSMKNVVNQCLEYIQLSGLCEENYYLHLVPHNYMAGIYNCFILPFLSRSKILLHHFNFKNDYHQLIKEFEGKGITHIFGSPNLFELLLKNKIQKNSIHCICTGSHLYSDLAEKIESRFDNLSVSYGITELCGSFTYLKKYDYSNTYNVGTVSKSINIQITNNDEIIIKSKYKCLSLINNGKYHDCFDKNGYYNTGDKGRFNDFCLSIFGRSTETINKYSHLVSGIWIESILRKIPYIEDAAVIFKDKFSKNPKIIAYVKVNKSEYRNKQKIISIIKEDLNHYEIPDIIKFIDKIPKSDFGKTLKYKLEMDHE